MSEIVHHDRDGRTGDGIAPRTGHTHTTFTDLCRSKHASLDEPGTGFLTFRMM